MKTRIRFFGLLSFLFIVSACTTQSTVTATAEPSVAPMTLPTVEVTTAPTQTPVAQTENEVSFSQDIFPIFQQMAASCHGNNGGLSLETYAGTMKVVVPGDPEGSKLYQRLMGQGGPVMPPSGPLPDTQIQLVYQWIKQGAKNN